VVKSLTGKDTAEFVSDLVIDSATNVYHEVQRKTREALAGAKAVGKAVSGWWSGLFH
jgi:DNA-binding ferritin-like protein (Dps family)